MIYIHSATCFFSRTLRYHFSLEGFTCSAKTTIATIKALQHRGWEGGGEALKFFENQKELLYATQFFQKIGEFVRVERTAAGNKVYHCQLPQASNGWKKTIKWFQIIGSFFDFVQFIFKRVFGTPPCLKNLGEGVGEYTLKGVAFNKIPVIESLVRKPKDFCIFFSDTMSVMELAYDVIARGRRYHGLELTEKLCKLISCIGKMILIFTGQLNNCSKQSWFKGVDVVTQVASQMKFSIGAELNNRSLIATGRYRE